MIAFVSEQPGGLRAMKRFSGACSQAGEKTIVWEQPYPPPNLSDHEGPPENVLRDIYAFQFWAEGINKCSRYGCGEDEQRNTAYNLWCYYYEKICKLLNKNLTHIAVWGSAVLGTRAAIYAAEAHGVKVACLEGGQFPLPNAERTIVSAPNRTYAEHVPNCLLDLKTQGEFYQPKRFQKYKDWWLASKSTKCAALTPDSYNFPKSNDPIVIWFDQCPKDSGIFWLTHPDDGRRLIEEGTKWKPYVKQHPKANHELIVDWTAIPKTVNIHSILPQCDAVMIRTSGVGIEAWMYDCPVINYGTPYYAQEGLVEFKLSQTKLPIVSSARSARRKAFMDYYIHEFQVSADDGPGIVRRIKREE